MQKSQKILNEKGISGVAIAAIVVVALVVILILVKTMGGGMTEEPVVVNEVNVTEEVVVDDFEGLEGEEVPSEGDMMPPVLPEELPEEVTEGLNPVTPPAEGADTTPQL